MGNALKDSVKEHDNNHRKPFTWWKNWKWITTILLVLFVLIVGGFNYYKSTHFHENVTINGIKVGGMTADQALEELKKASLKNDVYVGNKKIVDGIDTKMGFTDSDLSGVQELLEQQSFFTSSKEQNHNLVPSNPDPYRSQDLKKKVEDKLNTMNKSLKAPKDAVVHLENGEIVVSKGVDGEQYDIASLLKDYDQQEYHSEVHLSPVYLQPIKEDSEIISNRKKMLQEFLQQKVDYKVQDKVYSLKASDLIQNASVTNEMEVTFETEHIAKKISEINDAQSTLNKDFTFKTHSDSVISVKGEGYGWALDIEKETSMIEAAFKNETSSLSASNIYGHGWSNEGYGYDVTANHGIGDTYAEVSIADQQIWIYKEGELVLTTNVVTGNTVTGEDTSPGVWYILYKRTPYVLEGQRVGASSGYATPVDYWLPFTNSGQGFHDASWRSNWSDDAYIADGSGGCVNVDPSVMKAVYESLDTYDPVVIY